MEKENPIKFKIVKEDGYYSYHLPIITQLSILEDAIIDYNLNFVEDFYQKLGLCSQLMWDDDTYLYALMLRYLFKDNQIIMISDSVEELKKYTAEKAYHLEVFETHWSNRIEYTYDDTLGAAREFGFMSIFEFAKKMNYPFYRENKNNAKAKSRIYEATFLTNHLLKFFYKTYFSDVTYWCFLSGKDLKNTQKKLMNVDERPQVEELLNEVETMVTIQLGEDEGYEGYVLIYSKADISDKIKKMEKMIVDFGTRYEKFLPEIEDMVESSSNEEIFLKVKKFLDDFDVEYGLNSVSVPKL